MTCRLGFRSIRRAGAVCGKQFCVALVVGASSVTPLLATAIVVDPVGPALTNYTSLGEWNSGGNFEGWTTYQITNTAVTNGVLSGYASGIDPQVYRTALASGPDLDLGYNDYLELRIQVPATSSSDLQVFYGVTNWSGFSASRVLTIPNALIPKDGAFHAYRADMGLEVYWRGSLRDIRIDPLANTGGISQAFAIDYLRVGDLAGDVYPPRYSVSNPAPGQTNDQGRVTLDMESKHFRVLWDTAVATNGAWTPNMPHGTLRNLEETWQVYMKTLGYQEPSQSWTVANRDGNKYKVNLTTWYGGYWSGGDTGDFGRLNITPDGLRVDPPTWVVPHEFMHVCQMHQTGHISGDWWECGANYGRERWIYYYLPYYDPSTAPSGLEVGFPQQAMWYLTHGRHYYLCWPIFLYLDENPDGLPGLGGGAFSTQLWQQNLSTETIYDTIARLAPGNSLKDIIGLYARREINWDYSHSAAMKRNVNMDDAYFSRFYFAELRQRADDPAWWQVPLEMAPQQTAYTLHELIPAGSGTTNRLISVNFHGLPISARGADWRVSLVALSTNGTTRYSTLWNAGTNSFTLLPGEPRLFMAVAGTPDQFLPTGQDDSQYSYQSSPQRVRFLYEVQVTGATPKETRPASAGTGHTHPNGGGFVANTASVDVTAYVGPNATVLDAAQVRAYARVEDYAVVKNNAQVLSNAVVSGHAQVRDSAVVRDHAKIRDWGDVYENGVVSGYARVLQHGMVHGWSPNAQVKDYATVEGLADVWADTTNSFVGGDSVAAGDYGSGHSLTNGFQFGFLPYQGTLQSWIDSRHAPVWLFLDYEFDQFHDSLAKDAYGITDGYLLGSPAWIANDGERSGFLDFNGTNQYVLLDRAASDLGAMTAMAWVKPRGGAPNQPVFCFGAAVDRCLYLTPDDGAGHASFVVRLGTTNQALSTTAACPVGVWTHLAVALEGGLCTLFTNGVLASQGAITIAPDQLLAPNSNTGLQHNYLARGASNSLPFFNGSLDSFRVYTRALSASQAASASGSLAAAQLAYYKFNQASGTNALDSSGNGSDAALVNGPVWTNGVLKLDGISSYVQTPVPNGSERTLMAWIYPTSSAAVTYIESVFDTDVPGQYGSGWGLNGGYLRVILDDQFWSPNVPVTLNQWQHVALAFDANTARLYVNGVLAASLAYAQGGVSSANYRIGRSNSNPLYFHGSLAEAHLYSRALSDKEVAKLYAGGSPFLLLVSNGNGPSAQTTSSLQLNGQLLATNAAPTSVAIYWGATDGGTNRTSWGNRISLGTPPLGGFSATVTGLSSQVSYYYRAYASNAVGQAWAAASTRFKPASEFSRWGRRAPITFTGYTHGETLINFPVLVVLGANVPGFQYGQFTSFSGADLRFADANGVELNYEVDTWNTNGSSAVWVQLPQLSGTNTTIYAYWARTNATVPAYTSNGATWSEGFVGVWHLTQTNALNSVTRANGTAGGNTNASGLIGGAQGFGGANSISVGDLDVSPSITMSAWLKDSTTPPVSKSVVLKSGSYNLRQENVDYCWMDLTGTNAALNVQKSGYTWGGWHQIAGTYDGLRGVGILYRDGAAGTTNTSTAPNALALNNNATLLGSAYNGLLDEVRLSSAVRSADWLWAEWRSQGSNSSFCTCGAAVPTDADGNGLPDAWEVKYFGHAGVDPNADADGDGQSNYAEFVAGTSPVDPSDGFRAPSISAMHRGQPLPFVFTGHVGRAYFLERSDVLAPSAWSTIANTAVLTADQGMTLTDLAPPTNGAFYRLRVIFP